MYEGYSNYSGWDFWRPSVFRLWCRIFVQMMEYLLYEDVIFWSRDAIEFHYSKLQRVVFYQEKLVLCCITTIVLARIVFASEIILCIIIDMWAPLAQSAYRLTTGCTVWGSNPGGGARFSACPDRHWGPPTLLYNGYRVFPGGKVRPGSAADHSPPSSAAVMEE